MDDVEEAVAAAAALGGPVTLKALGVDRLGKVEAQGLALDLNDDEEVRAAYERMATHLGERMRPALVQRMVPPGADVLVDLHQHPRWGSTVSLGVGGAVAARPRRRGAAGRALDRPRRRPPGRRLAGPPADRGLRPDGGPRPLEDLVLRVSALADLSPRWPRCASTR